MRCLVREFDLGLIDIAPAPAFGRVITLDDGVSRGMIMGVGMPIGRIVAASDVPACTANA